MPIAVPFSKRVTSVALNPGDTRTIARRARPAESVPAWISPRSSPMGVVLVASVATGAGLGGMGVAFRFSLHASKASAQIPAATAASSLAFMAYDRWDAWPAGSVT
jgi:hypothetical protein